eukprot:IDg19970t1
MPVGAYSAFLSPTMLPPSHIILKHRTLAQLKPRKSGIIPVVKIAVAKLLAHSAPQERSYPPHIVPAVLRARAKRAMRAMRNQDDMWGNSGNKEWEDTDGARGWSPQESSNSAHQRNKVSGQNKKKSNKWRNDGGRSPKHPRHRAAPRAYPHSCPCKRSRQ